MEKIKNPGENMTLPDWRWGASDFTTVKALWGMKVFTLVSEIAGFSGKT